MIYHVYRVAAYSYCHRADNEKSESLKIELFGFFTLINHLIEV